MGKMASWVVFWVALAFSWQVYSFHAKTGRKRCAASHLKVMTMQEGHSRSSVHLKRSSASISEEIADLYRTWNNAVILSALSPLLMPNVAHAADEATFAPVGTFGGSNLSLHFTLGLYVLTLPGLYSLVTRSVKTKPVRKVYDIPGPANPSAKPLRQTAAEVMAYFKSMNYEVVAAEEVITFRGVISRSNSQAFFLTFCTFMGLGSLGLVLSTISPDLVGGKAYLLTLLSPYAGFYYWKNAQRTDEVQIKIETSDDDQVTSIISLGGKEDLERFSKTLQLPERGKVYVKGMFDDFEEGEASVESSPIPVTTEFAPTPVTLEAGDDVMEDEAEE